MAGSGYWRQLFEYEEPDTYDTDTVGQGSLAYEYVCTIRGTITPTQREVIDDLGVSVRTDIVIEAAYHPSVRSIGRLHGIGDPLIDGKYFSISSVVEPDNGKNRRLRITATWVAPA